MTAAAPEPVANEPLLVIATQPGTVQGAGYVNAGWKGHVARDQYSAKWMKPADARTAKTLEKTSP